MVKMALRRNLLASTIIAGTLIAAPAFAQTPAADEAPAEDTIVVTGSLIQNPNLAQSSPVNVTTAEEIQLRQSNVAEEVLRDIPGIVPNIGSAVNNGNGGASFVDLRGLGSNRNIVLLDGKRIAPSGLVGRVDLNNIPLALVDRVDALTGGASTTYGADAISGVINFITKKDFAGIEASFGEQITEKGDGNYLRGDVTIGANFDDGRGNAVFSIGYQESDPVYQGDRDFSAFQLSSASGNQSGSGTSVPSRITGTRPIDPLTGLPSTNPAVGNNGQQQVNPATGLAIPNYAAFNFAPYNIFQTPFKRYNMYGAAHYQASDAVELYTRGLFSKNTVTTIVAPSGAFGPAVVIPLSNPYLPAALRAQYCAFDIDPRAAFYQARFTPAQCAAGATAQPGTAGYNVIGQSNLQPTSVLLGGAYDSNNDGVINALDTVDVNPGVTLSRRLVEGAPRTSEYVTTIFDYRAGARGGITDSISWDVSGGYGESENRQTLGGYALTSRVRQALLATNATTCIDPSNGCVPLNAFGSAGSITQAQAAFLQQGSTTIVKTTLAQATGVIAGDFGVTSPWGTDAINFAVGGEYRKYTAQQRADSLAKISGELGGAGGAAPDIDGAYDVYEAFGELVVPLVQDKPFFEDLTVKGGIRYSHYTVGSPTSPKFNTTTYKGELAWSPTKDIKLRGGYAHSARAPNISELFSPQNTGLTSLTTDPCASLTTAGVRFQPAPSNAAGSPTLNLYNVCIAQGATPANIASIQQPTAAQANATSGGNVNLKPENSDSYNFGVVLTPSFVPGLSITADYYNIKVTDAITTPTPGDAITACFGATPGSPSATAAASAACTIIRRNSLTGGLDGDPSITPGLFLALSNLGELKTDGIDLAVNYRRDLGVFKLALSFTGNYTFTSKFKANQNDPASLDRNCVGLYSVNCASIQPKFQWNQRTTFSFSDIDLSVLWRHIDAVSVEDPTGVFAAYRNIPSFDYFDVTGRFGISKNVDFTIGVQNVFNKTPPVVGTGVGATAYNSGNTYPSTYDALGRRYAAGVKVKF